MLLPRCPSAISCMSAKFALIFFTILFVYMCLNVCSPPFPTYMRPVPLVTRLEIDIKSIQILEDTTKRVERNPICHARRVTNGSGLI